MTDVSKIALAAGIAAAAVKIQTTAKAHGTFNSPTTGEILYVDPKHDDAKHREPVLTLAEAKEAHMRGLIEDYDEEDVVTDEPEEERDQHMLGTAAAERTEQFAQQDDEGGQGSGTLDSRSSTAWADRDRVEGGVQGHASGVAPQTAPGTPVDIDRDSGDDDAPPAPAAKKPARKPAGKAE